MEYRGRAKLLTHKTYRVSLDYLALKFRNPAKLISTGEAGVL
jgi:hypothetical protein